jgi:hypothetical protein
MREIVRSGRRENFYVTDNSFIDHYARELQPTDIAVYHALERYMNYHTRSTWVGTAKIAEVLNISQRTVQRSLNTLADRKLIRIVRTPTMTTYFVMPVPPRAKAVAAPLFEAIEDEVLAGMHDATDACATPASHPASSASRGATLTSRYATRESRTGDTTDAAYKEEQNLLNDTLLNNTFDHEESFVKECSERVIKIFKLHSSRITAVKAAVKAEVDHLEVPLDADAVVHRIVTAANQDKRRGIPTEKFFDNLLARICAQDIIAALDLPATNALASTVAESVKAEAKYVGLSMEEVAARIRVAASEDRNKGLHIDKFYFENMKWRSGNGRSKQSSQDRLRQELDILHSHSS